MNGSTFPVNLNAISKQISSISIMTHSPDLALFLWIKFGMMILIASTSSSLTIPWRPVEASRGDLRETGI